MKTFYLVTSGKYIFSGDAVDNDQVLTSALLSALANKALKIGDDLIFKVKDKTPEDAFKKIFSGEVPSVRFLSINKNSLLMHSYDTWNIYAVVSEDRLFNPDSLFFVG